jgi:hypothetical protein
MSEQEKREFAGRTQKTVSTANPNLQYAISEKGAVSVYGMGRWPVTLYRSQWQELFAGCDENTPSVWQDLYLFMDANEDLLADDKPTTKNGAEEKVELYPLAESEAAILNSEANRLIGTGETASVQRAVQLMTLTRAADNAKGRKALTFDEKVDIVGLLKEIKARPATH